MQCATLKYATVLIRTPTPQVKRGVISWAANMVINPEDQVEEGEGEVHDHTQTDA